MRQKVCSAKKNTGKENGERRNGTAFMALRGADIAGTIQ